MGFLDKLFGRRRGRRRLSAGSIPRTLSASSPGFDSGSSDASSGTEPHEPREISATEAQQLLGGEATPLLLDVREFRELRSHGSIPGRLHIPMGHVPRRLGELDRERPVVVYCAHGVRSYDVACFLLDNGFKNVASLDGGFAAWRGEIQRGE